MSTSSDPQEHAAPQPPARKRVRAGDPELQARRRDLLTATRKLLRKGGPTAVTMRAVAQMVGMSTTVVYAMFPDKAALLAYALDDDLRRFSRHLQQAVDGARDSADALERVAQAYVGFGLEHPQSYRMMFMEQRPSMPLEDLQGEHDNPRQRAYGLACTLAADLLRQQAGEEPSAAAIDMAAHLLWEALHGATALRITLEADPWFARNHAHDSTGHMVQVLLAGLGSLARPSAVPDAGCGA